MNRTVEQQASAPSEDPPLVEPAERGKLSIDRTVLRKIAERAADAEPDCVRVRRRIAGVGFGEHGAGARVSGPDQQLRVRLDLALRYPSPIEATVRAIRERVHVELERAAGCHVRSVDVTVSALVADTSGPRVE